MKYSGLIFITSLLLASCSEGLSETIEPQGKANISIPDMTDFYSDCMKGGGTPHQVRNDEYDLGFTYIGPEAMFEIWTPQIENPTNSSYGIKVRYDNTFRPTGNPRPPKPQVNLLPGQSVIFPAYEMSSKKAIETGSFVASIEFCLKITPIDVRSPKTVPDIEK